MWAIIGIFLTGATISLFEIPPLVKKKYWREIIVYTLLLSVGLTLAILLMLNITIPTPVDFLMNLYRPITSFFERIFA